jgi:hypothetical protein
LENADCVEIARVSVHGAVLLDVPRVVAVSSTGCFPEERGL